MSSLHLDQSAIGGPGIASGPSPTLATGPSIGIAAASVSAQVSADQTLRAEMEALGAQLASTLAAMEALQGQEEHGGRAPLSIAQTAKRLGISTSRTLLPGIAAGLVVTIPWGRRRRITIDEIERLEREGFGGKKPRTRAPRPHAQVSRSGARLSYRSALAAR